MNNVKLWSYSTQEEIEIELGLVSDERPTIPAPESAERAEIVHDYCKGLSFGAALSTALWERGPL
jgi:hypothetical protein